MRSNRLALWLFGIAGLVFLVAGVLATPRRASFVVLGLVFIIIAGGVRRRLRESSPAPRR